MGTKRIGLARVEALMENLKREINLGSSTLSFAPLPVTAKTADFSAEAGNCYAVTKLDGCAVTLPAPTVGAKIKLIMGSATTNSHVITADAVTTLFNGYAMVHDLVDGTAGEELNVFVPDGTDDDEITLNRTTTGAAAVITLTGTATNRWFVEATIYGSGDVATPFS